MVIVIKKPVSAAKLEAALEKISKRKKKKRKGFDASKFAGKVNWNDDALKIQKAMRNGWLFK